jgi:lipid II:glycine glycyltransferase (peptidoglycan interpeptide bridge formation enzyme)
MTWKGFRDVRATIEIDLSEDLENLWENLDKDARWGVNKAKKSGLVVNVTNKEKDWKEFYKCYKETCNYGGIKPINLEEMKNGILFACYLNKKLIAGSVIKIEKEIITLFLNASKHEFLNYQPNNLLYWSIIEWGKKNNYDKFDLGGYQLNAQEGGKLDQINRFKIRWGGEIVKQPIYSKNLFYILGRKLIRNSRFFWWLNNKIKGR